MTELRTYGNTPQKKNSKVITRSGKLIPSKRFREWHKEQFLRLRVQWDGLTIKRARIVLNFTVPDKRKRDLTNMAESIMDLLEDVILKISPNYHIWISSYVQKEK